MILSAIRIIIFVLICINGAVACFGVIVGKKASADGSVLVGHDEQNSGTRILNFRYIPRRQFTTGETVAINQSTGKIPQVLQTNAFLWAQNVKVEFGDAYMNEWGVAVVSDACPSRENAPSFTDGGIKYMLRRIVAERAKSAREGVRIAGDLVHQFGYGASGAGRTYIIADANEAWLMAIAAGKHWLAQRVPDDEAAIIPNIYVSREIDLTDTVNFLGSPDLVQYAKNKGWYSSGTFIFTDVYGTGSSSSEYARQRNGQKLLTTNVVPDGQPLPFSVKPDKKATIDDVLKILHANDNNSTQEGSVFQLRSGLPKEIGCVYWRTTAQPQYSILTPWYCGIAATPANYCKTVAIAEQLSLNYQYNPPAGTFENDPNHIWWDFKNVQDKVMNNSLGAKRVRIVGDEYERRAYNYQKTIEPSLLALYQTNKDSAISLVTELSATMAFKAVTLAKEMNQSWITSSSDAYCKAIATAAPIKGGQPLYVSFDGFGCSNDSITKYSWVFGDGNSSADPSTAHIYATKGTYPAVLTVENSQGKKDIDTSVITVDPGVEIQKGQLLKQKEAGHLKLSRGYYQSATKNIDIYYTVGSDYLQGAISIRDLAGRLIQQIPISHENGKCKDGHVQWNRTGRSNNAVSPGIYFCSLIVDNKVLETKKIVP